jgi:hypothetical protein
MYKPRPEKYAVCAPVIIRRFSDMNVHVEAKMAPQKKER